MNSPFALLFLAVQQRIGAINDPDTSDPLFAFVDQDYGQLEHTISGLPPVSFPCALIDIESADFDNAAENIQTATLKISIRVGFAPYTSTSGLTPEEWKLRALAYVVSTWATKVPMLVLGNEYCMISAAWCFGLPKMVLATVAISVTTGS